MKQKKHFKPRNTSRRPNFVTVDEITKKYRKPRNIVINIQNLIGKVEITEVSTESSKKFTNEFKEKLASLLTDLGNL